MNHFRIAGVTLLLLTTFSSVAFAQNAPRERTISVTGEGLLRIVPDMATVRFGIVTRHKDPEEARSQNASAARITMNAVRDLGIDERKIRLDVLRLQAAREYNQSTRRYDEVGFEAIREVVVEVDDLDTLPTLVTRVVQGGANRLQGIEYGLNDRELVRNRALQLAVENARDKANLMAATLDVQRGAVLQINEQGINIPSPVRREMLATAMMKDAAAPEPDAYAAGEMEVQANVHVIFELK